jgi:hypothetical protein
VLDPVLLSVVALRLTVHGRPAHRYCGGPLAAIRVAVQPLIQESLLGTIGGLQVWRFFHDALGPRIYRSIEAQPESTKEVRVSPEAGSNNRRPA